MGGGGTSGYRKHARGPKIPDCQPNTRDDHCCYGVLYRSCGQETNKLVRAVGHSTHTSTSAIFAASATLSRVPILGYLSLFTATTARAFEIARLKNPQHREVYPALDIGMRPSRPGNYHQKLDSLIVELFHVRPPQHVSGSSTEASGANIPFAFNSLHSHLLNFAKFHST